MERNSKQLSEGNLTQKTPQTGLVRFYTQSGLNPETVSQSVRRYGRHRYNFEREGGNGD